MSAVDITNKSLFIFIFSFGVFGFNKNAVLRCAE